MMPARSTRYLPNPSGILERMLRRIRDAVARRQPLTLAPDCAAGILWDDKGPIDFVDRSLPVSNGLRADLLAFAERWEYDVQDDAEEAAAHDDGRALARRVATELGRVVLYEGDEFHPER